MAFVYLEGKFEVILVSLLGGAALSIADLVHMESCAVLQGS